jgi:hypothetical protein
MNSMDNTYTFTFNGAPFLRYSNGKVEKLGTQEENAVTTSAPFVPTVSPIPIAYHTTEVCTHWFDRLADRLGQYLWLLSGLSGQ